MDFKPYLDGLSAAASLATIVGVGFAAYQLKLIQKQANSTFEDTLYKQYRSVIAKLPVEAMLNESLSAESLNEKLPAFYEYFDLCNEQAFLHKQKKISKKTWKNWQEGIQQNLKRPAFAAAWRIIGDKSTDSFDELRKLL